MPVTLDSLAAEDAAYAKQARDAQATAAQQEGQAKQPPSLLQQWTSNVGRVTNSMLDSAVSEADAWGTAAKRVGQDAASGAVTGATNIADSAYSFVRSAAQNMAEPGYKQTQRDLSGEAAPPTPPSSPVWDHAKSTILDFRDAIAVQDPNIVDRLTQGGAQLAIPFAGYSRMLAGVHGFASIVASGAMTDLTALGPHDPRLADLIALGRHTEGKLGDALRTLAPDGSALNAYVNYLADRGNESEAEGRFKNVLDGFGANLIVTPLLSAAASTLKQGTAGLRYLAENGVGSSSGIAPSLAKQSGRLGERAPLRQGVDSAQELLDEQVRRDADAAHAPGATRPLLRQSGKDPAEELHDEQVRRDVEAAHKPTLQYQHDEETGAHFVRSQNGYTKAQSVGKDIVVSTTNTQAAARGKGEGLKRLEFLAREAHDRGGLLRSDVSVSPDQSRLYGKLAERGYDVQKNPNAVKSELTGNWLSHDPREPVYTVGPRQRAAEQVR